VSTVNGVPVLIEDGVPASAVDPALREVARRLNEWTRGGRSLNLFARDNYQEPSAPYETMAFCKYAIRDDVLDAAADITEGLAIEHATWECMDPDDADVLDQIAEDLRLDQMLRTMWRELFVYSHVTVAMWWELKTYKVRAFEVSPDGSAKRARRKKYEVWCPTAWMILDPQRVVPVGPGIFGYQRLAWEAQSQYEYEAAFDDAVLSRITTGPLEPSLVDRQMIAGWGKDPMRLLGLDVFNGNVFRVTDTKPDYEPFADCRLRSTFKLLDLKAQLYESDRVALIGSANYILLLRKGSKDEPARQSELDNLRRSVDVEVKLPVIVSDHRLEVQIVAPPQDFVLRQEKHDVLDRRLAARALYSPDTGVSGDTVPELRMSMLAKVLQARRNNLVDALHNNIAKRLVDMNPNMFKQAPRLAFVPRLVQVGSDQDMIRAVLELRKRNEISRDTTLEYLGFDQDAEAQRRVQEKASGYDEIFETAIPFSSPELPRPGQSPNVRDMTTDTKRDSAEDKVD
jgi:hypothetical protein